MFSLQSSKGYHPKRKKLQFIECSNSDELSYNVIVIFDKFNKTFNYSHAVYVNDI